MQDERFLSTTVALTDRTIAQVHHYYDGIALRFSDGTYTHLRAETDYLGAEVLHFSAPCATLLYQVGALSKEEFEADQRRQQEKQREIRRQHWEELSKEFGASATQQQ